MLQSRYLDSLSGEERHRVFSLTGALSESLHEWARKYSSFMRKVRVPQVCLTMAAASPFLEVHELLPAARLSLWLFAVDDLCDQGLSGVRSPSEALLWTRFERSISSLEASGDWDGEDDPLFLSLRDIGNELAGSPLFTALRPWLVSSLHELRRGMKLETEWSFLYRESPRAPFPSLHDYLDRAARHSIGTLPIYLCVLAMMRDESILSRLPRLVELGQEAAMGLRLANDLQGYERELSEGKLNSLVILQREFMARDGLDFATALAQARAEVRTRAASLLAHCLELGSNESGFIAQPERVILNGMSFAYEFYIHHDYHHVLVKPDGHGLDANGPAPT